MSASGLQVQMETQIQVHTYILREHQTKYINIDIGLLHTIHGSNVNIKLLQIQKNDAAPQYQ